jgi:hypothetical protein
MRFTVWPTHKSTSSNLINTVLENEKKEYFMPNISLLALYFPPERILFTSFPIFNFSNIHFNVVYIFEYSFIQERSTPKFFTNSLPTLFELHVQAIIASETQHNKCRMLLTLKAKIKFWPITVHNSKNVPESSWLMGFLYFLMSFDIAFALIWVL